MSANARTPNTRWPATDKPANGLEKKINNMQRMAATSQISLREPCATPGALGAGPPEYERGGEVETGELIAKS
jgi:hypothetical protein